MDKKSDAQSLVDVFFFRFTGSKSSFGNDDSRASVIDIVCAVINGPNGWNDFNQICVCGHILNESRHFFNFFENFNIFLFISSLIFFSPITS